MPHGQYAHLRRDCWRFEDGDWLARAAVFVDCPACLWYAKAPERERARQRQKRQAAIRSPPKPWLQSGHHGCSLCGGDVEKPRRSWCSQQCVDLWYLATSSQAARWQLVELHGPVCWECGGRGPLFVDHRRPLWSLSPAERLELRWWLPFNLQMLCPVCHATKTAEEAAWRARVRRGELAGA